MKGAALFTAICLMLCLSACAYGVGKDAVTVPLAVEDPALSEPIDGEGLAVAFSPACELYGLEIHTLPGEGSSGFTLEIFNADRDYETTLAGKALRSITVTDPGADFLWEFSALPAGDYLLLFSGVENLSPLASAVPSDDANGKIVLYRNGAVLARGPCRISLLFSAHEEGFVWLTPFAYPVLADTDQ